MNISVPNLSKAHVLHIEITGTYKEVVYCKQLFRVTWQNNQVDSDLFTKDKRKNRIVYYVPRDSLDAFMYDYLASTGAVKNMIRNDRKKAQRNQRQKENRIFRQLELS